MFKDTKSPNLLIQRIHVTSMDLSQSEIWSKDQRCTHKIYQSIIYESRNIVNTLFVHQQEND